MLTNLQKKRQIITDVASLVSKSVSIALVEYAFLDSNELQKLRKGAKSQMVTIKVIRNTLLSRALQNTAYASLDSNLTGQLMVMFAEHEPGACAKLIQEFKKQNEKLVVRSLSVDGQVYDKSALEAIASLPSRNEAISQLLSVMQAPIVKVIRTMREPYTKVIRVLLALKDKK